MEAGDRRYEADEKMTVEISVAVIVTIARSGRSNPVTVHAEKNDGASNCEGSRRDIKNIVIPATVIESPKRVTRVVREGVRYDCKNARCDKAHATPNRNAGTCVRNGTRATTSVRKIGRESVALGTVVSQNAWTHVRK